MTPKLYLSLGVSGAPEHIEGMQGAELIVAVNKDPSAAIFNVAHYGVVADLFDIADELTAAVGGVIACSRQGAREPRRVPIVWASPCATCSR